MVDSQFFSYKRETTDLILNTGVNIHCNYFLKLITSEFFLMLPPNWTNQTINQKYLDVTKAKNHLMISEFSKSVINSSYSGKNIQNLGLFYVLYLILLLYAPTIID